VATSAIGKTLTSTLFQREREKKGTPRERKRKKEGEEGGTGFQPVA